jgi:hypothetical protein
MKKLINIYFFLLGLNFIKIKKNKKVFFILINNTFIYNYMKSFNIFKDYTMGFWYNIKRSNQFLFYYSDFLDKDEYLLSISLRNQILQKGKKTGWIFFNEFLFFLKFNYFITGIFLILDEFLDAVLLPYKLYVVKFSNRNYYFPGPILVQKEQLAFVRKAFSAGIKKQSDIKYINKFFIEIIAFINQSSDSMLLQILNQMLNLNLEVNFLFAVIPFFSFPFLFIC